MRTLYRLFLIIFFLGGSLSAMTAACRQPSPDPLPPLTAVSPTPRPTSTRFATVTPPPTPTATVPPTPTATPEPTLEFEGVFWDAPAEWGEVQVERLDEFGYETGLRYRWETGVPVGVTLDVVPAAAAASRSVANWTALKHLNNLLDEDAAAPPADQWPSLLLEPMTLAHQAGLNSIHFSNGSGVRYIGQSDQPEGGWVAVFQGQTEDQADFVSAVVGLEVPSGLTPAEIASLPPGRFSPSLDDLDQWIASLVVNLPRPAVQISSGGQIPLTLFFPQEGGIAVVDDALVIEGFTQPGSVATLLATIAFGETVLVRETFFSELNGAFAFNLPIPPQVQGPVTLTIDGLEGRISRKIELVANPLLTNLNEPAVALRLQGQPNIVRAGGPVFFQGSIQNPIGERLTIGIFVDRCTVPLVTKTVPVPAPGGAWSGFVIVPEGISTSACAVAVTGPPDDRASRLAFWEVEIVPADSVEGALLTVGITPDRPLRPGEVAYVAGGAKVAAAGEGRAVNVMIIDESGEIGSVAEVPISRSGLWEYFFIVPDEGGVLKFEFVADQTAGDAQVEIPFTVIP